MQNLIVAYTVDGTQRSGRMLNVPCWLGHEFTASHIAQRLQRVYPGRSITVVKYVGRVQ